MKPPQYALVAYVRNCLGEFVEGLRRELDPEHAHFPAHVSILPPRVLQGNESDALGLIEQVCRAVEPFEVTMGDVETFAPASPTVFIRVARAAYKMRELHDKLNVGVLFADEAWPYMPHLTLLKVNSVEVARAAIEKAEKSWSRYCDTRTVLVDQLTFVRESGPNQWSDLVPVPLGKGLATIR